MSRTVNPRTFRLQPSAPGNTPIAAPTSTSFDVGRLVTLETVRIVIPSGHVGQTGIALRYEQTVILPWSGGSPWLVGNSHDWVFEMGSLEVGNPLSVLCYNLDRNAHTWEVHATVRDIPRAGAAVSAGIGAI